MRHSEHRPDLMILDDVEDTNPESGIERESLYAWYMNEVVPAGSRGARYVVLGNLTREDSLLMRLRADIQERTTKSAVFRAYPLLDARQKPLWRDKFRTGGTLEEVRRSVCAETWQREYLLRIVPEMTIVLDEPGEDGRELDDPSLPRKQKPLVATMKGFSIRAPQIRTTGVLRYKRNN